MKVVFIYLKKLIKLLLLPLLLFYLINQLIIYCLPFVCLTQPRWPQKASVKKNLL